MRAISSRYGWAIACAVICSWGWVWVAVFLAVVGALIGGSGAYLSTAASSVPLGDVGVLSSVALGVVGGAIGGFITTYSGTPTVALAHWCEDVVSGCIVTAVVASAVLWCEPWICRMQHYRAPSRREMAKLNEGLNRAQKIAGATPLRILMDDGAIPASRTLASHIIISTALLTVLSEEELGAVLMHEAAHLAAGDGKGWRIVLAAALPLVIVEQIVEAARRVAGTAAGVLVIILSPALIVTRFCLIPAMAHASRSAESAADMVVARAGGGGALIHALDQLRNFEDPGRGFGGLVARSHPPTELRIDALMAHEEARTGG